MEHQLTENSAVLLGALVETRAILHRELSLGRKFDKDLDAIASDMTRRIIKIQHAMANVIKEGN